MINMYSSPTSDSKFKAIKEGTDVLPCLNLSYPVLPLSTEILSKHALPQIAIPCSLDSFPILKKLFHNRI